jgi:hypothetical protein
VSRLQNLRPTICPPPIHQSTIRPDLSLKNASSPASSVVEFEIGRTMLASATPLYDPMHPEWGSIVQSAYLSLQEAVSSTLVPFAVSSGGTLTTRDAWLRYVQAHSAEGGVVVGHILATSVDPLQALYHLVQRSVHKGYEAGRAKGVPSLKVLVSCPDCGAVFAPWSHMSGDAETP